MPKRPPATEEEYHLALGEALSAWGHVEGALDHIFMWCMKPCDTNLAGRVFFAVTNFRDRLNIVDAAAQFRLKGSKKLATWDTLVERTGKRSGRRNEIAHAVAWVSPDFGAYGSRPLPYLVDLPTSWKRRKQLVLTPRALQRSKQEFDDLTGELMDFYLELSKRAS